MAGTSLPPPISTQAHHLVPLLSSPSSNSPQGRGTPLQWGRWGKEIRHVSGQKVGAGWHAVQAGAMGSLQSLPPPTGKASLPHQALPCSEYSLQVVGGWGGERTNKCPGPGSSGKSAQAWWAGRVFLSSPLLLHWHGMSASPPPCWQVVAYRW